MHYQKPTTTKTTRTRTKKVTTQEEESFTNGPTILLSQLKIDVKHKNETQKKLTTSIKNNDVTFCTGPAGTGKTYLSIAEALRLLKDETLNFKKIVLIKSVTTLKNEDIGFLKGGLEEKMEPFMYSFINLLEKLIGKENTNKLKEVGYIEILPISYLRGVSIVDAIILIDEAQNISYDNMKTILTRLGENSKMVFLGDTEQIDLKNKKESSLQFLINKNKVNNKEGIGIVEFNEKESVRHRLTSYFIDIFKDIEVKENVTKPTQPKSQIIKEKGFLENILSFFIKK